MDEAPVNLLLIEDDPDDAFLLEKMLSDAAKGEFALSHVTRLAQGLEHLNAQGADVVLLDLSLPDSQGLETFQEVHQLHDGVPVVVLTGLDDHTVALRAVQEGAQDYLVKGEVDGHALVRSLRYAIERQRSTYYQAVLAERERFDAAISQMSDGIAVTDSRWRITSTNRAARLLINLPEQGWEGRSLEDVLAPFTLSTPAAEIRASNEAVSAFEIARLDTHPPLYVDARLTRLKDAEGNLSSAVLMLRDTTDEKLARHVQASFFSLVPHKLRTPLAVLGGYLELCRHLPADKIARDWSHILDVCEKELEQVTDIVQKLLDFKALTTSQMRTELRQARVCDAVEAAISDVRRRHVAANLELTVDIRPGAEEVDATREHTTFVIQQLLDNAVKFGNKDPVVVAITAAPEEDGGVRISVQDNGPGIPHEYHDRIFEGFVQIEERVTGQVPGLGVGLRMAREVVEAYGGSLSLESAIGEGSTFSFVLPAKKETEGMPIPHEPNGMAPEP
ncbi:MAG: response regulator [Armatimonadetes bacterium]|nr:response regulator [Armatimonadota bacterium]MDI9585234.1 ATP-binding protein [Acidobacteriota bacterium]